MTQEEIKHFNAVLTEFTGEAPRNPKTTDAKLLLEANEYYQRNIWDFIQHNKDYFADCLFRGTVYRVIDCRKNKIEYDGYITHWTYDIDMFMRSNHYYDDNSRYCWLTANIKDGFYINDYGHPHPHCEDEVEVIYPMNKECVTEVFYGTYTEFIRHLSRRKP